MIGKVPKPGKGFKGLIRYLMHGDRNEPQPDRVAWTAVRNLAADDPELVSKLMSATASRSRRCQAPVYHYVISWHRDERPTEDNMRRVADTTCGDLGLDEHQLLYIAHNDTDHQHVHIVANRVHPEQHRAWNRRQDWVQIERSLRRQSEEMGMDYVPGRHNDPEKFADRYQRKKDREYQRGRRLGVEPDTLLWSKDKIAKERDQLRSVFEKASSWETLEEELEKRKLSLDRKGQGWVLSGDDGEMKLSALGKSVRLKDLEMRLGLKPEQDAKVKALRKEKARLFEQASSASAEVDLAHTLHELGMVSKKQLERSVRERDVALEKLDDLKPGVEKLVGEIGDDDSEQKEQEARDRDRERRRRRDRDR